MAQPASRAPSRTRPAAGSSSLASMRGEGSSGSAVSRLRAGRNGSVSGASAAAGVAGKMVDAANGAAVARTKRAALSDKSNVDPSGLQDSGAYGKHLRASSHDAVLKHKGPTSTAAPAAKSQRSSKLSSGITASSSASTLTSATAPNHTRAASANSSHGAHSRVNSHNGTEYSTAQSRLRGMAHRVANGFSASQQPAPVARVAAMDVDRTAPSSSAPVAASATMAEMEDEDMSDDIDSDYHSSGEGSSNGQSSKTDHEMDSDDSQRAADADEKEVDRETLLDDAASLADSELADPHELDPDCLLTLPPHLEADAQERKRTIVARYEHNVIVPNAQKAADERNLMVQQGDLSADLAAHDDELALMGLDPEEVRDTSMVAEYSREIFAYMSRCEGETMANPNYMSFQGEIEWHMRATLVDWLLQVHMRYHMLPETLWIAINVVDRFLSVRVVSLAKLQLVGVTAMFVAAKYEEILAPSVKEFVHMTENGYSRDEILKGERIILSTLDFNVSAYCSPYSWVRRISKADDYDIQTRTLSKFLMEVTLLDHRFLRARPSLIAAVGMFLAKKMLSGEWDDAFVYYSGFVEEQLVPGANLILEKLLDETFADHFVSRKYASKKFLKASVFARDWAVRNQAAMIAAAEEYASGPSQ